MLLLLPLTACAAATAQPQAAAPVPAQARAPGWTEQQTREILERTETIRLAPDLSHLGPGERAAVAKLIEVGRIFQEVYEAQRHHQALAARARLVPGSGEATLYRLFQGPIATTLDNRRVPFLAVDAPPPGKNVYPLDLTAAEYETYLAAHPERHDELTHLRSVVRHADAASLERDIAKLRQYPVLHTLHPALRGRLEQLAAAPDRTQLYAVPYSVAYADEMIRASGLLFEAADAVAGEDEEFARFLRNRARDLLSDDYESGDAAWITSRFRNLNAQIGAYETYDDELSGTRAFYSLNVLARRPDETDALRRGLQGLQAVEDALPYERRKRVREDIPVGVYDVVADFGQSRGGNTATILPNEAYLARRYGRTILLRANIMRSPQIFSSGSSAWSAVVAPEFAQHLTADSQFNRTLWHEIGHYLGVDRTADGRDLDVALGTDANLVEEMKADLVSLFAGRQLRQNGYFTEEQLRSHYASGIFRTLQSNRPRRDQPYQTMQLMQFNWFLDRGVLRFDPAAGRLSIDYGRYHDAVEALLREVLAIEDAGDSARSDAFVRRWTSWDDNLHGRIAEAMRTQQRYRYRLFTYAALGE
ncbi:MAG: hypothetical protein ACK4SZ_01090 [Allosphingosinicella sp.]|uniref:hypothetical protein n=1 Tax=Allosphingosinicella sp. TaxID=2823234 RepID=UPI0039312D4A